MDSTLNHEELARGDKQFARLEEELSKLGQDAARRPSDPTPMRFALLSRDRPSLGGWALRGFTGFLLAASVGVAAIAWWKSSYGDAASTPPLQPAPLARTTPEDVAPTAGAQSLELKQLLQSMARDLATMGQGIERLKVSQEQMAHDIANVTELFKANQDRMTRDIANVAEQLKSSQEQMAREIARFSEQNLPPKRSAPPPRPTATATPKPVPTLPSPRPTGQPQAEKPKLSAAPRQPTPVH